MALMLGTSVGKFQIPNLYGEQPALGLTVDGVTSLSQPGSRRESARSHRSSAR